jgi:hypothetical protein
VARMSQKRATISIFIPGDLLLPSLTHFGSVAIFAATSASSIGAAHAISTPSTHSFEDHARENSLATSSQDASPLNTGIAFSVGDALRITASGT